MEIEICTNCSHRALLFQLQLSIEKCTSSEFWISTPSFWHFGVVCFYNSTTSDWKPLFDFGWFFSVLVSTLLSWRLIDFPRSWLQTLVDCSIKNGGVYVNTRRRALKRLDRWRCFPFFHLCWQWPSFRHHFVCSQLMLHAETVNMFTTIETLWSSFYFILLSSKLI